MIERHDVEAWAQTYYVNNRQWLKRIDDIYPPNAKLTDGADTKL